MNYILKFLLISSVLSDILGNQFVQGKGEAIVKIILGIPFLTLPFLIFLNRNIKKQACYKKNLLLIIINNICGAIFLIGILNGLIFPIIGATPFYLTYYITGILTTLWIYIWVFYLNKLISSDKIVGFIKKLFIVATIVSICLFILSFIRGEGLLYRLPFLSYIVSGTVLSKLTMSFILFFKHNKKNKGGLKLIFSNNIIIYSCFAILVFVCYALGYQKISFFSFIMSSLVALIIIIYSSLRKTNISKLLFLTILLFSLGYILNFWLSQSNFNFFEIWDKSRFFQQMLDSEVQVLQDESSQARILEMDDVINFFNKYLPFSLLGFGHGSTYPAILSPVYVNQTQEGFIHNIHIGPILLLFRYGILGILLYIFILIFLIYSFFRILRLIKNISLENNIRNKNYLHLEILLSSFFMFISFFTQFTSQNVIINPMLGVSLGIFISMYNRLSLNVNNK